MRLIGLIFCFVFLVGFVGAENSCSDVSPYMKIVSSEGYTKLDSSNGIVNVQVKVGAYPFGVNLTGVQLVVGVDGNGYVKDEEYLFGANTQRVFSFENSAFKGASGFSISVSPIILINGSKMLCDVGDSVVFSPACQVKCGDGVCQEVVCLGNGCPCAETKENCAVDCVNTSIPSLPQDMDSCLDNPTYYWDQETNSCKSGYRKEKIMSLCSDPDKGKNIFEAAYAFGFRSYSSADDPGRDLRIRTGGKDGCYNNQLIENYCDENGYIQTAYIDCPNGCAESGIGACEKGELIVNRITCKFKNSEKGQECYLAGQWGVEDLGTKYCKTDAGAGSCVINYKDYSGQEITWKSTCGGYQYTKQDGEDDEDGEDDVIYFDCTAGETVISEILNKGFRNVYFQCYDGAESKSTGREACKSAEYWKKFAGNFCQSHCDEKTEKCGVNSFSIGDECYLREGINGADDIITLPSGYTCEADSDCPLTECMEEDAPCGYYCISGKCVSYSNHASTDPLLVCKDSCAMDGKCYPFGYRKDSKFCSDEGGFVDYKDGESCDNNFECSSNVCVSGDCISEGFMQKILNWFKRLFG